MKYFIIATKKSFSHPDSVEHIEGYGIYVRTEGGIDYYDPYTKEEFFEKHYNGQNDYYSWNTGAGGSNDPKATSELYVREITRGHPFLQSVGDETKRDNLLELSDMKGR